jgi:hypothetical protein
MMRRYQGSFSMYRLWFAQQLYHNAAVGTAGWLVVGGLLLPPGGCFRARCCHVCNELEENSGFLNQFGTDSYCLQIKFGTT